MGSSVTQVYFDAFLVPRTARQHCCPRAKFAISNCTHRHGVYDTQYIFQVIDGAPHLKPGTAIKSHPIVMVLHQIDVWLI
jgi:hypothetical protein